jgi:hypothetical protein
MAAAAVPRRPHGLGARGGRFWRTVAGRYEMNPGETELLAEVCRSLDLLDLLETELATSGLMAEGSMGQLRPSLVIDKIIATRALVGRLVTQLNLPQPEDLPAHQPADMLAPRRRHA